MGRRRGVLVRRRRGVLVGRRRGMMVIEAAASRTACCAACCTIKLSAIEHAALPASAAEWVAHGVAASRAVCERWARSGA